MSAARSILALASALSLALAAALAACGDDTQVVLSDAGADATPAADALPAPPREDGSAPAPRPVACGAKACSPSRYEGVIDLPACCTAEKTCGLDLVPLGALRPVPDTCTAPGAPGTPSDDCEAVLTGDPDGGPSAVYQGCCRPNATCGVFVKLGDLDLGCQPAADFFPDAAAPAPCILDASTD